MLLQPLCSVKIDKDSGDLMFMTRFFGKCGVIIKEIRDTTRASIRLFSYKIFPKVASEDDEMVQIIEEPMIARKCIITGDAAFESQHI